MKTKTTAKERNEAPGRRSFPLSPYFGIFPLPPGPGSLLLPMWALFAWYFSPAPSPSGEGAQFQLLAQSLAKGQGFHQVYSPAAPEETRIPAAFPSLLALLLHVPFYQYDVHEAFLLTPWSLDDASVLSDFRLHLRPFQFWPFILLVGFSGFLAEYSTARWRERFRIWYVLSFRLLSCKRAWAILQTGRSFFAALAVSILPLAFAPIGSCLFPCLDRHPRVEETPSLRNRARCTRGGNSYRRGPLFPCNAILFAAMGSFSKAGFF